MRAVVCKSFGDESTLEIEEIEPPKLGPQQVRVAVKAAGISFADTLFIFGVYQTKVPPPFIPGVEIAGEVTEVAAGVTTCKVGDRVLAMMVRTGAFAEEVTIDAVAAIRIPDRMTWTDAAGFPGSWGTSYHALTTRARLKAGETVLVHGAGSGVGLTAVAIAHRLGAKVIATAGSPAKLAAAREQGADLLIDYSKEDIRDRVKAMTDGVGVNVVYDPVGGKVFEASLRCIAPGGRLLVIGFAGGTIQQIPANIVLVKNCDVVGYSWGACWHDTPESGRQALQELLAWYDQGRIQSHVSTIVPMAEAASALALIKARAITGKAVMSMI